MSGTFTSAESTRYLLKTDSNPGGHGSKLDRNGLLAVKSTTIIVDSGKSIQRCLQFVSDDQLREIEEVWVDDVRYSQPSIQRRIADFIVLRGRHGLKPG